MAAPEADLDAALARLSPDARRLVWVIALGRLPVTEEDLAPIWAGTPKGARRNAAGGVEMSLVDFLEVFGEGGAEVPDTPEELDAIIDVRAAEGASPIGPLLDELSAAGLVGREGEAVAFDPTLAERVDAWMYLHPGEQGSVNGFLVAAAHGARHARDFEALRSTRDPGEKARAIASALAGIRCYRRGHAGRELADLALAALDDVDVRPHLAVIVAELERAERTAVNDEDRLHLRVALADALSLSGEHARAAALFARAIDTFEARLAWTTVASAGRRQALCFMRAGDAREAQRAFARSAKGARGAGIAAVEALHADVVALDRETHAGHAASTLPFLEERLRLLLRFWTAHLEGKSPREAPDRARLFEILTDTVDRAILAAEKLDRGAVMRDLQREKEAVRAEARVHLGISSSASTRGRSS